MQHELTILAPAKVNLYLRVVGRRADGYHLLHSFMAPIGLYDELYVGLRPQTRPPCGAAPIRVTSDSGAVPCGPENLAHKAAALFLATVHRRVAMDISITKRIPIGSGLGGGSSDAATVLLALNALLGSPLQTNELCNLAAQIGADVPFFVHGHPAVVTGVGDRIRPMALPISIPLVVCWDGYVLSTRLVYSRVELPSLTSAALVSNIRYLISGRQPISELLVNDLEAAGAQIHPEVLSLKVKLVEHGALGALMTGTGSAVFGVWPDAQSAQHAAAKLREEGLWAEAVHTLDVSPAVAC